MVVKFARGSENPEDGVSVRDCSSTTLLVALSCQVTRSGWPDLQPLVPPRNRRGRREEQLVRQETRMQTVVPHRGQVEGHWEDSVFLLTPPFKGAVSRLCRGRAARVSNAQPAECGLQVLMLECERGRGGESI